MRHGRVLQENKGQGEGRKGRMKSEVVKPKSKPFVKEYIDLRVKGLRLHVSLGHGGAPIQNIYHRRDDLIKSWFF